MMESHRRSIRVSAARILPSLLIVCTFFACRATTESGPQPAHVIAAPERITMLQKGSVSLAVSVTDKDDQLITGAAVSFTSSDASIVTVTNLGVVNSVGPAGTTSVIAKSGEASTTIPVTVQQVASVIVLTPDPISIQQKATLQLNAKVLDAVGAEVQGAPITFASGNPSILAVSSSGLLTSLGAAGTTSVTASSGTAAHGAPVVITQVATDLLVSPPSPVIAPHGQVQLTATVVDAIGAPMPIAGLTWTSSDESIATVSGSALVSAAGQTGHASVTAKSGNLTRIVPIDVVSVAHPTATSITSIPLEGTSAIGISSTGVILAPSFQDERTYRVDPETQTTTTVSGAARGLGIAFSSDGARAYVANPFSNRIDIIDVASNAVVGSFGTTYTAGAVLVSRDNQTLYAGSGSVLVVYDLATQTEKTRISLSGSLNAITLHPSRNLLYVSWSDIHSTGVSEIDLNTNAVTRELRSFHGSASFGQAVVSLDGQTLCVPFEHELDCYDLTSSSTFFTPQGGPIIGPSGLYTRLTPDGKQIWVVGGASVSVVDLVSRTYQTLLVPAGGRQVVFTLDGSVAVITNDSSLIFVR